MNVVDHFHSKFDKQLVIPFSYHHFFILLYLTLFKFSYGFNRNKMIPSSIGTT